MARMAFAHLVDPPRLIEGGILFTMDTHDLQRTVCVTDAALDLLASDARSARDRLRYVMQHIEPLAMVAQRKASDRAMPELIVIDAADVADPQHARSTGD